MRRKSARRANRASLATFVRWPESLCRCPGGSMSVSAEPCRSGLSCMAAPPGRLFALYARSPRLDYIAGKARFPSFQEDAMVAATAKKTNGKPDPKHNIEAIRQAYLRPHRQARSWRRCGR